MRLYTWIEFLGAHGENVCFVCATRRFSQTSTDFDKHFTFFTFNLTTPVKFTLAPFDATFASCHIAATTAQQFTAIDGFWSTIADASLGALKVMKIRDYIHAHMNTSVSSAHDPLPTNSFICLYFPPCDGRRRKKLGKTRIPAFWCFSFLHISA